jgi:hypothetical protein
MYVPGDPVIAVRTVQESIGQTNIYYLDEGYDAYANGTGLRCPWVVHPARFNNVVMENTAGHRQDRQGSACISELFDKR